MKEKTLTNSRYHNRIEFSSFFEKYGMLVVLGVLFLACSLISSVFLRPSNLFNITRQVSVIGIISIGMTFVILTGGIDLSVGSVYAFATLVITGLKHLGAVPAAVIALVISMVWGLLAGILVTKGRLQPFIATLGLMTGVVGFGLTFSRGQPILGAPEGLKFIGQGTLFGIVPFQSILFIITAAAAHIILNRTRLGRHVYAVGGNEEGSRLSGISVDNVKITVYVVSSFLAGFAGVITANHMNFGEANIGSGMELDAIAAVAVGGTTLGGGSGGAAGTVIGVLIIGVLNNLLNLINVPGYTQKIVKGVIIIAAVLLQSVQENRKK
ncbi:MAG: ABC transporter permease [Spirochaetia bacterium]|nr:ABC transporter permease [Spirochaetia bacterium]